MKQTLYLVVLFTFTFLQGQNKKTSPKNGKIIFSVEQNVYNNQKLDSSIQVKKPVIINMFKEMYNEISLSQGLTPDTIALNKSIETKILPSLDLILDPRKTIRPAQKHIYKLEDSIIKYQIKTSPLDKNNQVTVINRTTGKQKNYTLQDSILVLDEFTISVPVKDSNKNLKIKEYREITKNIKGFNCFKIIVTRTEPFFKPFNSIEDYVSNEFKEKYIDYLEPTSQQILYVTEEIQFKYHPFINLSEVLYKYYPLEIISTNGFIDGVEKKCTVEEIQVN